MSQLTFDLSSKVSVIEDEKKDQLISFRVGPAFKADLERIVKARHLSSLSALVEEYVIDRFTDDLKQLLLQNAKRKCTLEELLR